MNRQIRCGVAAAMLAATVSAVADDGMWTFDNPPAEIVRQRYGVALSNDLLAHLQRAAVHFGASASFVSPQGLMLTNHHVALGCLQQLSSREHDLVAQGHLARSSAQELRCPGGTAQVLQSTEDVTASVRSAVAAGKTDEERNALRKQAIAGLESRCSDAKAGVRCEVVSLYSGSLYHLYRFRQWDDVRLVFAPEYQAAFFGGDPDNFVYPRFDLDFALMRVYENGKPLATPEHLSFASRPVAEGDLVFVAGHPGRTDRLQTLAQLQATRDVFLPMQLASAEAQQALLKAYSARSPEAARQARDRLFGTENWLKSMRGEYAALKDPALLAAKQADEAHFRAGYAQRGLPGDPWSQVEAATSRHTARAKELWALQYGYKSLFNQAGWLVELARERARPEAERLAEYRDNELPEIERKVKANSPYYRDLEIARLAGVIREAQGLVGDQHPFVKLLMADTASPEAAAERWVRGSKLDDAAVRTALLAGGAAAIEASNDPLIVLARSVYPLRRDIKRWKEEQVETPIEQAAEHLGQGRFAIFGRALPPDATATLRLSFGRVAGYESNGIATPWKTTFGGLLARADGFDGKEPFDLAPSVARQRTRLDSRIPLNFVSTADIIGGNSGSPVVNAHGELVGLIFDSNLEALGGRFVYTEARARSVAVHAAAILHALERVYGAGALAAELRGNKAPAKPGA